jgi:hypothetical protein
MGPADFAVWDRPKTLGLQIRISRVRRLSLDAAQQSATETYRLTSGNFALK